MKLNEKYTFMLPIADSKNPMTHRCIKHLSQLSNIKIIVIDDFGKDEDYYPNEKVSYIHNTFSERQSLSKIWNQCIKECPTEYVIITSWRQRPTVKDIILMDKKLKEGFGLVAIADLHTFVFSKHLTSKIGFFDEGFESGQYEDTDYLNRLYMNDIAIYFSNHCAEESARSTWLEGGKLNKQYYISKWIESSPVLIQIKQELNIEDRKIYEGTFEDREYLSFNKSELIASGVKNYYSKYNNKLKLKSFD